MTTMPAYALRNSDNLRPLLRRNNSLTHVGNGIWIKSQADNTALITIGNQLHYRVLDRLYIPCKTTELSSRQIATINRFREKTIGQDPQYIYRTKIRALFSNSLGALHPMNVLEIGPGRYPLQLPNFIKYSTVEIDPLAIEYLRSAGIDVTDPVQPRNHFDLCMGVFVFHFDVSLRTLTMLSDLMKPSGVFIFNVVTTAADTRTLAFSRLTDLGFSATCIDLMPRYKKTDVLFICSRGTNSLAARLHSAILREMKRG